MIDTMIRVLDSSVCIRLTETLIHFIWQGFAIALLATITARSGQQRAARVRHGIYLASLMAMCACLPVTYLYVGSPGQSAVEVVAESAGPNPLTTAQLPLEPAITNATMPMVDENHHAGVIETGTIARLEADLTTANRLSSRFNDAENPGRRVSPWSIGWAIRRCAPYAVAAYFLGLLIMVTRLGIALWGGHRLRRCAQAMSDPLLLNSIRALAARNRFRFAPIVAFSERITIPVVSGIIRPVILLPVWLLTEMDPEQVLIILAHEMAHIRRFDLIVNLFQRLVETVLFFHPAVWWISYRLSAECENCCDDAVVRAGYEPLQYASTLVRMAELCVAKRRPIPKSMLELAATDGNSSQLKQRIIRLLGEPQRLQLMRGDWLTIIIVAGLIVATTAGVWKQANAGSRDQSTKTDESSAADKPDEKLAATDGLPAPSNLIAFHGRVIDEEGKPIEGAELWYALPTGLSSPSGDIIGSGAIRNVAATDSDGNFSFSVPPPEWKGHKYSVTMMRLTARAPGYGCDFMPLSAFETNPIASEPRDNLQSVTDFRLGAGRFASRTLKLPKEVGPIQGRLVDLDGQPLEGVEVCVETVEHVNIDMLKQAFQTSTQEMAQEARRSTTSPGWLSSVDWQVVFPRLKTDQNGEFTMSGLGRNQMATVTLFHERVDAEKLYLVGTEMEPQQLARSSFRGVGHKEIYLGTRFTHAVGPAIPVSGVVTELDSGKPVANAQVSVERLFQGQNSQMQLRFAKHIKTVTDDQGRYRLIGIPPGTGHVLQVNPQTDQPLFPSTQEFSLDSTQTNATIDLKVLRGLWIEGTITDAQTGDPLAGAVDYFPFHNNRNASRSGGIRDYMSMARFSIGEAGHYRVAGLPGPGVVMVLSAGAKVYPLASGADKIEGYDAKRNQLPSVMVRVPLENWNQISFVDPPASAESHRLDIALSTGLGLSGRIVNPDGSTASDVEVLGQFPRDTQFRKLRDDSFKVNDYVSERPRNLLFTAKNGSLVGCLLLEGKAPDELIVQLEPAVTVRGRLVDVETDEPAARFHPYCESSKFGTFFFGGAQTDDRGRFEMKGMLAGTIYKMDAANRERFVSLKNGFSIDLTNAKPGDVIELGDVTGKNARGK